MATVMPSPTNLRFAGSPDTASLPSSSPPPFQPTFFFDRSSGSSDTFLPPPSPYPQHIDPSPVDSNGTENTEIEDDAQAGKHEVADNEGQAMVQSPGSEITGPMSPQSALDSINTSVGARARSNSDETPQSVIHVPSGFQQFAAERASAQRPRVKRYLDRSENVLVSPSTPEPSAPVGDKRNTATAALETAMATVNSQENHTAKGQTVQEVEAEWRQGKMSNSLEDLPETLDTDRTDPGIRSHETEDEASSQASTSLISSEEQAAKLKTALGECWTLCNTLASLSSDHRERMFSFSGTGDKQEQAWKSCWKLCQNLYESRDEQGASQVGSTLELCRAFCQALFEARQRVAENTDSVLRVSFELNNHLYNTHDRNLPEVFRERTLDFYLTLCHRLMKQRTSHPWETDALLRACWSLAEMLFSLRQNDRDGKPADEELLGSAVQACWDLCDLFREGWTQIRPDRTTPKANQTTFAHSSTFRPPSRPDSQVSSLSASTHPSKATYPRQISQVPETPTTFIDDSTTESPDEPNVPNILVLGPDNGNTRTINNRWSSNASTLSGYSDASSRRTRTSTATASGEEAHIMRIKLLILKAAMNAGYQPRRSPSGNTSTASSSSTNRRASSHMALATFVESLPPTAFGTLPWQTKLLDSYKRLALQDSSLKDTQKLVGRRAGAADVAKAVAWMVRQGGEGERYACLRELYKFVFGFGVDEGGAGGGGGRGGTGIST